MFRNKLSALPIACCCFFIASCGANSAGDDSKLVSNPDDMNKAVQAQLRAVVGNMNNGRVDDSITLNMPASVTGFYQETDYKPVWSNNEKWQPVADTLCRLIFNAAEEGLFPKDYHFKNLSSLKNKLDTDSLKRMDAVLWSRADMMLTDGFIHIVHDFKYGRITPDSTTIKKDTDAAQDFYAGVLKEVIEKNNFSELIKAVQPRHKGYWELKKGIKRFLDSMDKHTYTYVSYPYKKGDSKDSVAFIKNLQRRLNESGCIDFTNHLPDSAQLNNALKKYQKQKGQKADGKITSALIRMMNISDAERFKRIAITLDRYKLMEEKMPAQYIWVNLPGYYLWVIEKDTIALESKVICGKPDTRTPLLTSELTDMVTYPTWTVPTSIIQKSNYIGKLKNNPGYLNKLGLHLVDGKGQTVDPYSINWAKYSKGIPYRVMQGSGDNNALGIMKFNFNNPFAVYLHDTNQRYLFKNAARALSHGCVRVQEWEKLAFYIARNDSIKRKTGEVLGYNTDSIRHWLTSKQRRKIDIKNHIPLYIRYFSCEGKNGKVVFYDDIYGEDKVLRDKYFANK